MVKVIMIPPAGYECNSYAVTADGKDCILIDCPSKRALDWCAFKGLSVKAVLLTHGHFDHMGGCAHACARNIPVYCGKGEDKFIFSDGNRAIFGINFPHFDIEKTLSDGEELNICGVNIKVIATAGHTEGGVSYVIGDKIFSGDTLFCESVGRTDFYGGDSAELCRSVKKLFALEGDYTVYCGHGESTTLEHERKYNPYVRA